MFDIPSHPILSCDQALEWEKSLLTTEGAEWRAMNKVGKALGSSILSDYREVAHWPAEANILVLVGKGHNGGDALLAAAEIVRSSPSGTITVIAPSGPASWKPLTRRADEVLRASLPGTGWSRRDFVFPRVPPEWSGEILIDGLMGMQFRPPLREPLESFLDWCKHSVQSRFRVAVDIPSGRSTETEGLPVDVTYATGLAKQPLFQGPKLSSVGRIRYLDIGFFDKGQPPADSGANQCLVIAEVLADLRRARSANTYKNKEGKVWLIGGSLQYPGSILLSAMAAIQAGAGLVHAMVPEKLVPAFAAKIPEVIWIGCPVTRDGNLARETRDVWNELRPEPDALVIGPGLGAEAETHYLVGEIGAESKAPLVLDAQGLNPLVASLLCKKKCGPVLATPHPGELPKLSGSSSSKNFCPDAELLKISSQLGWWVLLKAPPYTRLSDGNSVWVVPSGGPALARGGSGDLLAGMVGRLVARERAYGSGRWGLALAQAAYWHGLAAERASLAQGTETLSTSRILSFLSSSLRD